MVNQPQEKPGVTGDQGNPGLAAGNHQGGANHSDLDDHLQPGTGDLGSSPCTSHMVVGPGCEAHLSWFPTAHLLQAHDILVNHLNMSVIDSSK